MNPLARESARRRRARARLGEQEVVAGLACAAADLGSSSVARRDEPVLGDQVGRLGPRGRERADRIETDGVAADVRGEQLVHAGWALSGGTRTVPRPARVEPPRRRIVDDERTLDAVDPLEGIDLGGVGVERLDVRGGRRWPLDVGQDRDRRRLARANSV